MINCIYNCFSGVEFSVVLLLEAISVRGTSEEDFSVVFLVAVEALFEDGLSVEDLSLEGVQMVLEEWVPQRASVEERGGLLVVLHDDS